MLKTVATLLRGASAAAGEDLADRNALLILDQQIREVAASVEAGKHALALAMVRADAEAKRQADLDAQASDLETRAVAALHGGREDLAAEAAQAILALEADREAARGPCTALRTEVERLRRAQADAGRRLAALQRGRHAARASEAIRRLRGTADRHAAANTVADAEATLARLRARQTEDGAVATALCAVEAASADAAAGAMASKLGAAGFGARTAPNLDDIMARLRAKATPAQAS